MDRIKKEVVKFDSVEKRDIKVISEMLQKVETMLQSIETDNGMTCGILMDNIDKIEDILTFFHVMSTNGLDV